MDDSVNVAHTHRRKANAPVIDPPALRRELPLSTQGVQSRPLQHTQNARNRVTVPRSRTSLPTSAGFTRLVAGGFEPPASARCPLQRLFSALALISTLLLTACSPVVDQILPTPLPTATDTPIPSPTPSPLPQDTPVPLVTAQVFYITATPVFLTPRPELLSTRTPTPIPFGALRIDYFVADVTAVTPGDSFLLFWSVQGVQQARIFRLSADGEREQVWEVRREGSLLVRTRADDVNVAQFLLVVGDDVTFVEQTVSVALSCTAGLFFENSTADCPPQSAAVASAAAQQNFERGLMLWLQAEGQIYVLFNDGRSPAWATYVDEFAEGQQESDPANVPPEGLLQPVRGFGLVWRTRADVRDRLGWAVAPELAYTAQIQGDPAALKYVLLQEGDVVELAAQGSTWRRFTPDNPPATAPQSDQQTGTEITTP